MCCPDSPGPCTSWQLTAAAPSCWASCHDVTHAGHDELGRLPASAAAAAPGCWLPGPSGREISASGAPHRRFEPHVPPSRRVLCQLRVLSALNTLAGQHPCPHTCRFNQGGCVLLTPFPVTGSACAAAVVLCCLQSVAGLLDAQACAAEGLQPRLAAEAGLQALRASAGQLHAFERLWACLQLGQRLQALRQPGMPPHAGIHSALPAVALHGTLPVPSSPTSRRAVRARLAGLRHLVPTHKGTGRGWVLYARQSTNHLCRGADERMSPDCRLGTGRGCCTKLGLAAVIPVAAAA